MKSVISMLLVKIVPAENVYDIRYQTKIFMQNFDQVVDEGRKKCSVSFKECLVGGGTF